MNEMTKLITDMRLASVQVQAVKKLVQSYAGNCDPLKQCLQQLSLHLQPEGRTGR